MSSLVAKIARSAVLALAASCSAKPLQPTGTGGSGGGSIMTGAGGDAVTGTAGGVASGAGGAVATGGGGSGGSAVATGGAVATGSGGSTGTPFTGRHSYSVSSTFGAVDGGVVPPPSFGFTMIVDADHLWMIAGANGGGSKVPLQPSANGYRVDGAFHLALSPSVCSAYVTYSDLDFSFDAAGRLRGTSDGTLTTIAGDVATSLPVKMSVAGVDDVAPPRLDLFANDIADPFSLFTLVSSEPLPLAEAPVLRAAGGDVVFLSPSSGDDFTAQFTTPPTLLRYGESYGIDIAGMVDFAGNTAQLGNVLSFTTRDPPPLVAADGFESVTAATLGGGQMLSSAAGDSTISGARSLYLPRADAGSAATTQFALRLPVAPGSTVVRFAYQYVNPGVGAPARFAVASVGRSIATMAPSPGAGATTSGSINGAPATLGPVATATINLPADAAGEIVVARLLSPSSPCSAPLPPTQGMIIDDLRTE